MDFSVALKILSVSTRYTNEDKDTRPLSVTLLNIATDFLTRLVASTSFKGQASTFFFTFSFVCVCFGGATHKAKTQTSIHRKIESVFICLKKGQGSEESREWQTLKYQVIYITEKNYIFNLENISKGPNSKVQSSF